MTNSLGTIARVLDISRQEEHKNPGFALYMYEWFVSINQWFKKYDSEIYAALE